MTASKLLSRNGNLAASPTRNDTRALGEVLDDLRAALEIILRDASTPTANDALPEAPNEKRPVPVPTSNTRAPSASMPVTRESSTSARVRPHRQSNLCAS